MNQNEEAELWGNERFIHEEVDLEELLAEEQWLKKKWEWRNVE